MDKNLKYRAICPLCGKSFNIRDARWVYRLYTWQAKW